MEYKLRLATLEDVPGLRELIARSIHGLGAADYTRAQIEAALQGAFGVDTVLIRDGTYFVVETRTRDIVACAGWSRRRTLFGGDTGAVRDESALDPKADPAKIRAFFVDPAHARYGIGRAILARSEADAIRAGFSSFELMATFPGVRFYEKCGYVPDAAMDYPLPGGLTIRFVPMHNFPLRPEGERTTRFCGCHNLDARSRLRGAARPPKRSSRFFSCFCASAFWPFAINDSTL